MSRRLKGVTFKPGRHISIWYVGRPISPYCHTHASPIAPAVLHRWQQNNLAWQYIFFLFFVLSFTVIFCKSHDHFLFPFTKALVPPLLVFPLTQKGESVRERERKRTAKRDIKRYRISSQSSNIQKFMECTIRSEQQQSS